VDPLPVRTGSAQIFVDSALQDYSLLIGVQNVCISIPQGSLSQLPPEGIPVSVYSTAGIRADAAVVFGPGGYCLGVIDVLQRYTLSKRLERVVKCYILRQNPRGVSVLPPDDYGARFREQISRMIVSVPPQNPGSAGVAQQIHVEILRMG
jgi:hypothetical protein